MTVGVAEMTRIGLITAAAVLALVPAYGATQTASAPPATGAQVDAQKTITNVRRVLATNYVLADVRPKLDAALAQGLAAGRYNVSDPNVLAERINADLSAVAHDKHLGIQYNPTQSTELAARPVGAGADDAP